jgi:TolA-binding protein
MTRPFELSKGFFLAFLALGFALSAAGCEAGEQARETFKIAEDSLSRGDYGRAIFEYQKVADKFPGSDLAPKARLNIGDIYNFHQFRSSEGLDSYEMAIEVYRGLIEAYPDRYESYQARERIAKVYADVLGSCDQAEAEYRKITENRSYRGWYDSAAKWQYLIGECFLLQRSYDDSIVAYRKVIDLYPGEPIALKARFQIADAYYLKKDYSSAVREYEELAQAYPGSDLAKEALFWSGVSYELLGERGKALKVYEGLLGRYPKRELVQERISRLTRQR